MKFNKQFCLKIALLFSLSFLVVFFGQKVQADDGGADFSVTRDQPAAQVDSNKTYFDLKIKQNQTSNFKITISNDSDTSNDFTVSANNARTNQNLIIDYSPMKNQKKYLVNSNYNFQKIVSPTQTKVTIPPHSSKQVEFQAKMPAEKFNGEVLGGIYVRKEIKKYVKNGYTNRFNFVIPVLIHEDSPKHSPKLKLEKADFDASPLNNQIQVALKNSNLGYATGVSVEAKVYNQKNKMVTNVKNNLRAIAPNSKFTYIIPMDNKKIKSGKYTLDLTINDPKDNKEWHWREKIVVSQKKAIQSNKTFKQIMAVPIWYYIFAGLLLLIIILLIVLVFKRKKNK